MRKLNTLTIVIMALVAILAAPVIAQEKSDTDTSAIDIRDLIDRVYDEPASSFLQKKLDGPNGRGFRIVYAYEGKRYTFDYDWYPIGVQIWIRPDSTYHPAVKADGLSDDNVDGEVDSGSDGAARIFAKADSYYNGSAPTGLQHQPYWQEIYNHALVGLTKILDSD